MIIVGNGSTRQTLIHEFHNFVSGLCLLALVGSLFTRHLRTMLGDIQVYSWTCALADTTGFLGELQSLLNVVEAVGVLHRFPSEADAHVPQLM